MIHFTPMLLQIQDGRLAGLLTDATLKCCILFCLAAGGCFLWKTAPAATRHLIWFGAILGALCFPLLSVILPSWQRPLWTISARSTPGNQLDFALALRHRVANDNSVHDSNQTESSRTKPSVQKHSIINVQFGMSWVSYALVLWAGGFVWFASRICLDSLRLRWLRSQAGPVQGDEWRRLAQDLGEQLGIHRPVELRHSSRSSMPLTWGFARPVILLPAQAAEWPDERRRVVLLHELAHVKRLDDLSQLLSRVACALYWFNPCVWIAARQMCIERERASDDVVLGNGFRASEYASHLVDIARAFPCPSQTAGIAMARSAQIESRVSAILEASRSRKTGRPTLVIVVLALAASVLGMGGNQAGLGPSAEPDLQPLARRQLARVQTFSEAKLRQSQGLATGAGQPVSPEFQRFFAAATNGNFQVVTNMYEDFKRRHPQYSQGTNLPDSSLSVPYWSPVLEICLAYDHVVRCDPHYTAFFASGLISSIPPGSVYFGGTDPGRGILTAFSKSQIEGDPFFILTQNALADSSYLEYLQKMYGEKIYVPTASDSQACFESYSANALQRWEHDRQFSQEPKQILPGENVRVENGKPVVSGQIAVMAINGLLAKLVFDRNPGREFYLEESLPIDWMYPHLKPHGLILKINREALPELAEPTVEMDRTTWRSVADHAIGGGLNQDTSVASLGDFIQRVYVSHDLSGFAGDPAFIQNDYAKRLFSKLRSSIAGVYAWRSLHPSIPSEAERMRMEADFAFRQAFVLCPYSPEVVFRYSSFLTQNQRADDALIVARSALAVDPGNKEFSKLVDRLRTSER